MSSEKILQMLANCLSRMQGNLLVRFFGGKAEADLPAEMVKVAHSFFKGHLIPEIADSLDWDTLQIADSVRRESNKRSTYTDITYTCDIKGQNIPIYLHVEQERNVDPSILERILQYNHRLYTKHRKQDHKKLPIIINFVLYNGNKRKNYPHHEHIYDYFGPCCK